MRGRGAASNRPRSWSTRRHQHQHQDSSPPHRRASSSRVADTLEAAADLVAAGGSGGGRRVGVLNMASPLRAGGGVLSGATSQEESLCARTTLLPSLRDDFYRLPDVGGVYTRDVLVFRDRCGDDLAKRDRFYVDVVSAAMLRFPDIDDANADRYAEPKDGEMAVRKTRAVVAMLAAKGADTAVLGAWGCSAYGNPVYEIARAWRSVLLGRRASPSGLHTVVFAIKDAAMAGEFARHFGDGLEVEGAAAGGNAAAAAALPEEPDAPS